MKKILLVIVAILFSFSTLAKADTPSLSGPAGLILTRSADVLDKGEHHLSLFTVQDSYEVDIPGNERDVVDKTNIGAFQFLFLENLEIGVTGATMQPDSDNVKSWKTNYVNGFGKVRLAGGREKGYGITASGYGSMNSRKKDPVYSSGEDIYAGELNVSFFGRITNLHLSGGTGQEDVRVFTTLSSTFVSAKYSYVSAAFEIAPSDDLSVALEWQGKRINEKGGVAHISETSHLVMLAIKYSFSNLTLSVAGALETPDKDADPDYLHAKYLAGLSYGYNTPPKALPKARKAKEHPLTAPISSLSQEVEELRREIESLKESKAKLTEEEAMAQPGVMEAPQPEAIEEVPVADTELVEAEAGAPMIVIADNPYNYLRVEVINVSGMAGLGETVANFLKEKGYNVSKVSDLEVHDKGKTYILHKKKFINEGVMVARAIPKDQDVLPAKKLPANIHVRVVAGADIAFLME
ncbi:MAG: LytR C-terminal domain-containing protein [Deltaproteobacteria bacterium]|nr:LytR C-terminal domain-containing protein [Deltaproteobacteria bacterium]